MNWVPSVSSPFPQGSQELRRSLSLPKRRATVESFTTFSAQKERGSSPLVLVPHHSLVGCRERGSPSFWEEHSRNMFPWRGGSASVIRCFFMLWTEKDTKRLVSLPDGLRTESTNSSLPLPPTHACTLTHSTLRVAFRG